MKTIKRGPVKGKKLAEVNRSEFGQRLFAIRRTRHISQKQLGQMVGVTLRVISYYERDPNGPPVALAKKIAKALNISMSYLAGESPLKITTEEEVTPVFRKRIDALKTLPRGDQIKVLRMIDDLDRKNLLEQQLLAS